MIKSPSAGQPTEPPTLPIMTHEKAIELVSGLMHSDDIDITQDEKDALALSIVALIADNLNIER